MDDPLNPPDQAPADDTPINNAVETDATTTIARGRPTDEPEEDTETPSSTSTTATPVRETETSTRSTATTISTRRTTISDEATTSTSDTETETKSSSTTESTSTTERSTSTKPALSSETTETSTTPSTISSSTAESTTTSTETSSRIEERPTTRELKPSRPSIDPSPTRLPSKGEAQGDGLGTGTIIGKLPYCHLNAFHQSILTFRLLLIGIALAGFVGAGLLVLLIGALLRWRRKRLIAKKSEGLPAFKTILDFADTASDKDSITNANRKAAEDISTVPVTPPYRPEMRQPSKRQSWYDDPQNSEPQNVDDYTFQPTNGPPPQGGHALARANTGQYKHGNQRALATDDYMPEYANHGAVRPPPQLIPGMHGSQQGGGAFDHLRGQNWCGQYPQPDMRDAYNDRRDGAPVRNRHFPTAPGRSYTSDNPYPFVPTAHNR